MSRPLTNYDRAHYYARRCWDGLFRVESHGWAEVQAGSRLERFGVELGTRIENFEVRLHSSTGPKHWVAVSDEGRVFILDSQGTTNLAERCGHSACSQHFIDTGKTGCIE